MAMRPPYKKREDLRHPAGPDYNDYEQPAPGEFYRARSQIVTMWRKLVIPLDVTSNNVVFEITGDFIYCDMGSTGVLTTLEFNNQMADEAGGFLVGPGWYHRGPFTLAKMAWQAQPGKVMKLLYATGLEAYPGTIGFTINGTTLTAEQGSEYGASYQSNTQLVAGTTSQVFSPAQNPNGAVIWQWSGITCSANPNSVCLIAKAGVAPIGQIDGDVLGLIDSPILAQIGEAQLFKGPFRIAKNKGLWFFSANTETAAIRGLQFTLL